jgi:hypothetical protein
MSFFTTPEVFPFTGELSKNRLLSRDFERSGCMESLVGKPEGRFRIKPGYAIRGFMNEYLVIPVGAPGEDDSKMAVLSPVAEFIWSLLEEPRSLGELLEAVTNEFDVTPDVAEPDILDFLRELDKNHFLLMEDETT